jgi:magnesium chelatase subunit I
MKNQLFTKKLLEKDPFTSILGQQGIKNHIKSALLANRHIIVVGQPGIGKTTLAKNIAALLPEIEVVEGCKYHCDPKKPQCPDCKARKTLKTAKIKGEELFVRIQGSPDLTVEDLLGDIDPIKALKYGPLSLEAFTPGKIFKANRGILFFDELNRCPEKLQNSLLQVLEEGIATIGSYDVDIETNFIFIGTMNPEDSSTEKLSDVFADRFDFVYMSYPDDVKTELRIVKEKSEKLEVEFPDNLSHFAVYFVRLLRESDKIEKKPSVRASIGLFERAQANALIDNRKKVIYGDIERSLISVLAHRIRLKPSVKYLQSNEDFIKEQIKKVSKDFEEMMDKEGDVP